jgi:hypothetical protein
MRATQFIKGVAEGLDEAVGGNYLYHATSASGLKGMLSSGSIRPATAPQAATSAQTRLPTVSVTRDWGYASGSNAVDQMAGIGRDAILVLDRNAVESNFKTLGTSQNTNIRGLAFNPYLRKDGEARSQNTDPAARANAKAKAKYAEPTAKAGGEFEEAVVVPKGALPLKGTMVGFWINPKSELMKDPAIMNDPRRLDMVRPNQFVKATQQQGVAEGQEESCPHCGGAMFSEMIMNEKKDACYYKVKSRYKVWPSAYASGALVKCRKSGADSWGDGGKKNESSILEGIEQVDENLNKWFKEKWVRFGPDGKIRGDCARGDDSEGKPKCLPQSKAQNLGKEGRASAAARKRREDPNPERSGKAINVNTKKKSNEGVAEGSKTPTDWMGVPTKLAKNDKKPIKRPSGYDEYIKQGAKQGFQDDPTNPLRKKVKEQGVAEDQLDEKWSQKYKDSINCSNPKGFSQKAHCQGKNK